MERSKTHLLSLALAVSVGLLGMSACAAGRDEEANWLASNDYRADLGALLPMAEKGDAEAQYRAGFLYDQGLGGPSDFAIAAKWFWLRTNVSVRSSTVNVSVRRLP